jgi:hypothetical protein
MSSTTSRGACSTPPVPRWHPGVAGQLHYAAFGGNTLISGDVNADKLADFSILVAGTHAFGAADFVL